MSTAFKSLKESASAIRSFDPLSVDSVIWQVPEMNGRSDTGFLINLLREILPAESTILSWSFNEAAAATRDIGILLGSIKRHGLEPCDYVAGLETILTSLGRKAELPPRDTVVHYTYWNPEGIRQRRYTHLAEENDLIDAVREAYPNLYDALSALVDVMELDIGNQEFGVRSGAVLDGMRKLVRIIKNIRETVDPLVFARCLRPYFEPIRINGEFVKGPGAVELPLYLIDHFLWSSNIGDQVISDFQETYLPRLPGFLKDLYLRQKNRPPLTSIVGRQISGLPTNATEAASAFGFVLEALDILIKFRGPHYFLATKAYESRDRGHDFTEGSGGYTSDTLKHILQKNVQAKTQFENSIGRKEDALP